MCDHVLGQGGPLLSFLLPLPLNFKDSERIEQDMLDDLRSSQDSTLAHRCSADKRNVWPSLTLKEDCRLRLKNCKDSKTQTRS
jgi:hypothetical protein